MRVHVYMCLCASTQRKPALGLHGIPLASFRPGEPYKYIWTEGENPRLRENRGVEHFSGLGKDAVFLEAEFCLYVPPQEGRGLSRAVTLLLHTMDKPRALLREPHFRTEWVTNWSSGPTSASWTTSFPSYLSPHIYFLNIE